MPTRSRLVLLHRCAGLAIAGFLIVAGLTGAIISWDDDLDHWVNPHLRHAPDRGATLPPLALAARAEAADPRAWATYFGLSATQGEAFAVFVEPRPDAETGELHELGYNQVFIDPVSGQILGRREWGAVRFDREHFVAFLYALHFSLCVPAFWGIESWGSWLMGGVALLWVLDCFVGFLVTLPPRRRNGDTVATTWWIRWKPSWKIKWSAAPYRLAFGLHRALGLWLWLPLFVLAVSATSLNLEKEVARPIVALVSAITPLPEDQREPAPSDKPIMPRVSLAEIIERAESEGRERGWTQPLGAIGYLQQFGIYRADFFSSGEAHGSTGLGPAMLYLDGMDGHVIGDRVPWHGTAGDVFLQLQFPLHSGRIAGLFGRIFMSVMGLVVVALSVTGIVIWWKKRSAARGRRERSTTLSFLRSFGSEVSRSSRHLAPQVVRERRERIGELSRGFRWRQRYFEVLRARGWIALDPWMRRSVGVVGSRHSSNKLRTDLHQGLPRIWTCITRWGSGPTGPRDRHFTSADIYIRVYIFHESGVIGTDATFYFLGRGHGLALTHTPGDIFHIPHEAAET